MNRRELHPLVVVAARLLRLRLDVRQQRELGQELGGVVEPLREAAELLDVLDACTPVRVVQLQVFVVARVDHQLDHRGGPVADVLRLQLRDGRGKLRPRGFGFLGHRLRNRHQTRSDQGR